MLKACELDSPRGDALSWYAGESGYVRSVRTISRREKKAPADTVTRAETGTKARPPAPR